jgi:Transposase family tnp2
MIRLKNCGKNVYLGHRRFLNQNHPYRRKKKAFYGKVELEKAPISLSGKLIYSIVKNINIQLGKKFQKIIPNGVWKKKSVFWELPYWPYLDVRHCLDEMHIIKNICESLVGTLLNIQGKMKDGVNARKDMVAMGIRSELAPQKHEK